MTSERTKAIDDLIAQDADLIAKLRDEDSYYRLQEKHWCIDAEELERQRLAAADRIAELEAENARLREDAKALSDTELTDCEVESALVSEGILHWGADGERFERMFKVVMKARAALKEIDNG